MFRCVSFATSVIGVALVLSTSTLLADEYSEITEAYKAFNTALLESKRGNSEALRAHYSSAMNKSQDACYLDRACRLSDDIFREVIKLTKYDIISFERISGGKIDMRVRGSIASGKQVDLRVTWLIENGAWKIDEIAKLPANWDLLRKRMMGAPANQ